MVRNIVVFVIIGVLVSLGYFAYKNRAEKVALNGGEFTCQGCDTPEQHARFLKENSGETADGNSERKNTSAKVSAEDAARDGGPVSGALTQAPTTFGGSVPAQTSSMVEPAPVAAAMVASEPVVVPTTPSPGATPTGMPPAGMPTTDTVSPNPPNGMVFAGKGTYQWYRQGNLTWRVDTASGRSCIIYATMEEWRKQLVISHGCGRNA